MKNLLVALSFILFGSVLLGQTYTITDNFNQTVNGCSGTATDGGGNYGNNVEGVLTICSGTPGMGIVLNFSQFNLENNYDYLTIYDGPSNVGYPILGSFTGTTSP
ncbi:MAG: hypothetical protein KDC84_15265, partial [Crocinitomicaceae bacterium]|nr:hypothetical protein [Crocinitomicaceae bacterium]